MTGSANDHFSGDAVGQWRRIGDGVVNFTLFQNAIGPDGNGSGVYVINGSMRIDASGTSGSGTSNFQILDVTGAVTSGTAMAGLA